MKTELHASAETLAARTIDGLTELGFVENRFCRHRQVVNSKWRGTMHPEPEHSPHSIWADALALVKDDREYRGTLELEVVRSNERYDLKGGAVTDRGVLDLPQIPVRSVAANEYKKCDLHLSVDLEKTPPRSVDHLECLIPASVDRPGGSRRIFSLTFLRLSDGQRYLDYLRDYADKRLGVVGKIVLERTVKRWRAPLDISVLPTLDSERATIWLAESGIEGARI